MSAEITYGSPVSTPSGDGVVVAIGSSQFGVKFPSGDVLYFPRNTVFI